MGPDPLIVRSPTPALRREARRPCAYRAQHDLGDVLRLGELEQGIDNILAGGLVVAAAERLHKSALGVQYRRVDVGESVLPDHVEGQQLGAGGTSADPRGTADQCLALRPAAQGHQDALPGLPGSDDAMFRAVALQPFLHPVGQPQQGDLAQGGEVTDPEVVSEGGLDAVRRIDVAMDQAAAEHLRWQVDQFDLVGPAGHLVGQGLPLGNPRDLPYHVVEGLQVLDIERGDNIDSRRPRSSWTSCHRLALRAPGTLEWASSSTSATWGRRASTASRSISVKSAPRWLSVRRAVASRPSAMAAVGRRPCGSTKPTTTSVPRARNRCPSASMAYVFPTPGAAPR